MDVDFYRDALESLAESDHYSLIFDQDDGKKISATRLNWLVSIALEKGNIPLIAYYNDKLNQFVVVSSINGMHLYISKD